MGIYIPDVTLEELRKSPCAVWPDHLGKVIFVINRDGDLDKIYPQEVIVKKQVE